MIYIVSGYPRTGTSMMMFGLQTGGLEVAYSKNRESLSSFGDNHYHPNYNGFYEVSMKEYKLSNFPLQYQGKLIKVMLWGLDSLAVNLEGYRIIIMSRNPEEIRQSFEAAFNEVISPDPDKILLEYGKMMNRKDVQSVNILEYRKVIENPEREIGNLDWPIDVIKAASIVDPQQYRFRIENLIEGI